LVGFTVDPRITIGPDAARFYYQSDNILRDPTDHFRDYQIYATNFKIASGFTENLDVASGVPESSTWTLMLVDFAVIGGLAYGRARRQTAVTV
jgi:hypothetical protein